MRRLLPLGLVLLGALVLGAWQNEVGLRDPVTTGPRTGFTAGHYLADAVFAAQLRMDGYPSTVTPLAGWPDVADFRALVWPMLVLGALVGPLPAVNLFFAGCYALNVLAGWALARTLGLETPAATAVAGLVGFSPWALETLTNGQVEQALVATIALTWAAWAAAARGGPGRVVLLPIVVLGSAMATPHLALAACLALPVAAALDVLRPRGEHWGSWPRHGLLLGLSAGAALLAHAYHAANFAGGVRVFFPKGTDGRPTGLEGLPDQATLRSLLLPPTGYHHETNSMHPAWLGFVVLGVGVVAMARGRPLARAAGVVALVLVGFAFGPEGPGGLPLPFVLLERVSPSIGQSASPYRMVAGAVVALAIAAGSLVTRPWQALGLVGLAWVEALIFATRPFQFQPQAFERDPVYLPFREHEGAVLDLPLVGARCPEPAFHYATEAAFRQRPTPVLTSAPAIYPTLPGGYRLIVEAWQAEDCGPRLEAAIKDMGFTGVVLHTHFPSCPVQKTFERCLVQGLGEGERAPGMRWWDPLPPMSEAARAYSTPYHRRGGSLDGG